MSRLRVSFTVGLLFISFQSFALSDFRDVWRQIYPDSRSDDIGSPGIPADSTGCQLCHMSEVGGAPWNPYGWAVRTAYRELAQTNIEAAIRNIEGFDSDADGATSIDEINNDFQPGWTIGNNNTLYSTSGSTTITYENQPAPYVPSSTAINFPPAAVNRIAKIRAGTIAIELEVIASNFDQPVRAVAAPGHDDSLFVVEQTGKIYQVELSTGVKTLFLDVTAAINSNGERGLLGLAFHPSYMETGLFYTYQSEPVRSGETADFSTVPAVLTADHRSMIVEYETSDPSTNSGVSERQNILVIDQPQGNHNGGDLVFGPDNYLYVALGDGGSGNDLGAGHGLRGNGRDNTNPLGSILRIDPLGSDSVNGLYGIPIDNPFVEDGDAGMNEIFAYGLRNPYRFSFDSSTGDLYVGDVGQQQVEEVNLVSKGDNLGWNWQEGNYYFYSSISTNTYISNVAPPNLPNDLVAPIAQYKHADGVSVIGGYVYRGSAIPCLSGHYVFAEYTNRLLYLDVNNAINEFVGDASAGLITGFGEDSNKELYIVSRQGSDGKLQKIVPSTDIITPESCVVNEGFCFPITGSNNNIAVICM